MSDAITVSNQSHTMSDKSHTAFPLMTFLVVSVALFMVTLDNLVVTTALPVDPRGPRRVSGVAGVDGQRLHAGLRGLPADRRGARRPLRPPADVRDRRQRSSPSPRRCAALAPSTGALVAARALQGLGAAIVTPLTLTLLADALPAGGAAWRSAHGRASAGIGVALGPVVGGAIAEGISWHWIFWLNVPIGLALVPLALASLRESHGPNAHLDLRGVALAGSGLIGARVRRSSAANELGWTSATTLGADRRGRSCCSPPSSLWERRAPEPMLPLRFFRSRAFSATNAVVVRDVLRRLRLDLPALAVLPDRPGLLAAGVRAADAAVDGDADVRRAGRRAAVGPHRLAAADGARGWRCRPSRWRWLARRLRARRRLRDAGAGLRAGGAGMALVFAPSANAVLNSVRPRRPARPRARRTRSASSAA